MQASKAYPHNALELPVPQGLKADHLEKDDTLKAWLENLPLADPVETAKQLLKTLLACTQSEINSNRRLKLLEIIQQPVELVTDTLEDKFIPSQLPLTSRKTQYFQLLRELYLQMAVAYKQVFATQIDKNLVSKEKNLHIIALHRCLMYLEKVILLSALAYEAYPRMVWQEVHLLFTYCSINKLDRVAVENRYPQLTESTIKQHYKRILLFAVASPFQLGQYDMMVLYRALPDIDDRAGLLVIEPSEKKHDIGFYVNLHADAPPAHVSLIPANLHTRILILETAKLLNTLQASLTRASDDGALNKLPAHLREVLIKNWGYIPHRHFRRSALNTNLKVITELNDIYDFIDGSGNNNLSHAIPDAPPIIQADHHANENSPAFDVSDISVLTMGADEFTSQKDNLFMHGFTPDKSAAIDGHELLDDSEPKVMDKSRQCQTVNQSSQGFCVNWSTSDLPGISVGELVCIRPQGRDTRFTLCVVRWLKDSDEGLLAGIEILSEDCRAVLFRSVKADSRHNPKKEFKGLLLAGNADCPAELMMPKGHFSSSDKIVLSSDSMNRITLILKRLMESTGLFDRYQVVYLP